MTGTLLLRFFDLVLLSALAAWVGGALGYLVALAPVAVDGGPEGGRVARSVAPRYFTFLAIATALTLPADICGTLTTPELRSLVVLARAGVSIAGVLLWLYAANTLTPAWVADGSDPSKAVDAARLGRRVTVVTAGGLLIGFAALAFHAYRPWPTTVGLVEPTQPEIARRQYEALRRQAEGLPNPVGDEPIDTADDPTPPG